MTIELIDVHGPFAGRLRPYSKSAAENALASGLAKLPEPEPPTEPAARPLPADFPGYEALAAAEIETYEAVPDSEDELRAVPGIGRITAQRILKALG